MKIVYLITGLGIGGAEQLVRDLSFKFSCNENSVTIISLTSSHFNIPIHNNINFVYYNLNNGFFHFFLTLRKVYLLIYRIEPDILHTHMFHSNVIGRLFIKFLKKNTVLICSAHSNNEGGNWRMFLYRVTNFLCDEFYNVSGNAVLAFESKRAVSKNKMKFIYNGININKFPFSDHNFKESDDAPVFLNVGRLTDLKDHENLINAFSLVVKKLPESILNIAGDGCRIIRLKKLVNELNLSNSVNFLGTRYDIPELMQKSNVFVLSSSHEGFGIVLAEAMASGLIIVSTDCGGAREVLGDADFIVPIKNSLKLSEAMLKATSLSVDYKKRLIINGRQRVIKLFDINEIFFQWLNVYKLNLNEKNK
jgi:glycosyltransferase involved in cell wall biosynthesis